MGREYTEAQKRATTNYQKTLANIGIRVKREEYARYKAAAEKAGYSLREYILLSLEEKITRDFSDGLQADGGPDHQTGPTS